MKNGFGFNKSLGFEVRTFNTQSAYATENKMSNLVMFKIR